MHSGEIPSVLMKHFRFHPREPDASNWATSKLRAGEMGVE
jgi:hypothetical protein